jgi:hypothetical protein
MNCVSSMSVSPEGLAPGIEEDEPGMVRTGQVDKVGAPSASSSRSARASASLTTVMCGASLGVVIEKKNGA